MAEQREAIEFLADPRSYGAGVAEVERIDTHSAMVFLAGDHAYKIKRAVNLGFLDFSTLALRRRFCNAEIRLNRRTAPSLYLRVATLTRQADGGLAWDGDGEVVEYVVILRRFDQHYLLDRMAERGELDAPLMCALADRVATFHGEAEQVPGADGAAAVRSTIQGNRESFQSLPSGVLDPAATEDLTRDCLAEAERLAGVLGRRAAAGRVRVCHGDLHLKNICLFDGEPTPFDCIEFNRALVEIDVLYDLAFLLMDLVHRGLPGLANTIFNRYLDRRDEADGVAALPLFMAMRAGIRAHVGARAAAVQSDALSRREAEAGARGYLERARQLLSGGPPCLVAVAGRSGSGKSNLAYALAPRLGRGPGARVLRSDVFRKRRFGVAPETPLPEQAYRPAVSEAVYAAVRERAGELLDAGQPVVVDMVLDRRADRDALEAVARERGVAFAGYWLSASAEVLRQRVDHRDAGADASDANREVLERQLNHDPGAITWTEIDAAGSAAAVLEQALRALPG